MGSPSFEGFHVRKQESNTFNTRIVCIVSCSNKKNIRTKQNRKDEKHSQISINIKIHTNYVGVRATAIMLRSLIAISAHRKGERLRSYIGRPLSEKRRACSHTLSNF